MLFWRANNFIYLFILFYLLVMFVLHSRESELYRSNLDGRSALAWELPFSRCLSHIKTGASR